MQSRTIMKCLMNKFVVKTKQHLFIFGYLFILDKGLPSLLGRFDQSLGEVKNGIPRIEKKTSLGISSDLFIFSTQPRFWHNFCAAPT